MNAGAVPNRGPLSAYLCGAPTYDASRLPADGKFAHASSGISEVDLHIAGALRKIPDRAAGPLGLVRSTWQASSRSDNFSSTPQRTDGAALPRRRAHDLRAVVPAWE